MFGELKSEHRGSFLRGKPKTAKSITTSTMTHSIRLAPYCWNVPPPRSGAGGGSREDRKQGSEITSREKAWWGPVGWSLRGTRGDGALCPGGTPWGWGWSNRLDRGGVPGGTTWCWIRVGVGVGSGRKAKGW